jgi:hypothetical protein
MQSTELLFETGCLLSGSYRDVITRTVGALCSESRVEARSNTSTATLRVVGGDEKGSLESETVKYGHKSYGTRTRKLLRWRGPGAIVNDLSSCQRERPASTNPQLSDSYKNLVVSPRRELYSKIDWPTDRRSQYKTKTQTEFNCE